jgi:hypothetical protein
VGAGEPIERRWYVRPRGSVEADDGGYGAWVCVLDLPPDKFMDFEILADAGHYWGKPVAFDEAEMDRRRAAFVRSMKRCEWEATMTSTRSSCNEGHRQPEHAPRRRTELRAEGSHADES